MAPILISALALANRTGRNAEISKVTAVAAVRTTGLPGVDNVARRHGLCWAPSPKAACSLPVGRNPIIWGISPRPREKRDGKGF